MLEWGWATVPNWLNNKLTEAQKKKKKKKSFFLVGLTKKNKQKQKDPLYPLIIASEMHTQSSQILKSSELNHFILFYFKYEMGFGSY